MKNLLIPLSVALIALAPAQDASAQAYPTKPIRLLVPFPAGGSNDIIARVIGQKLSTVFSQQVIVDNRGGASGIIAAELAAGANPDGYTLLFGGAGVLATTPVIHLKLRYDPLRDFAPVSLIATAPYMPVTNPSLPVKAARDIIVLAKATPGELNHASGGVGGPPHLTAELFKSMSSTDIVHIPYTGGAQATIGTLREKPSCISPAWYRQYRSCERES